MDYTDDVHGIIIGGFTYPYEFWTTTNSGFPCYLPPYRFARGSFETDAEAEAWVKAHYPEECRKGVEMRCFE